MGISVSVSVSVSEQLRRSDLHGEILVHDGDTTTDTIRQLSTGPTMNHVRIRSFKDLIVWQRAIDLGVLAYQLLQQLPKEEKYALGNQIRRAAASIPANIAEGTGRGSTGEYV